MKKLFLFSCLLLWVFAVLQAQTQVDLKTQSKSVDLSGAAFTIPARTGTVLPTTCLLGEVFFKTNAAAGQNIYTCSPANTWTLQVGITVAATTNLLAGDNTGNVINSGISPSSLVTLTGAQTLTNKSISASQITGLATSATTDATNAANISAGIIAAARLPNPTTTSLGGVEAIAPVSHNFLTGISVLGIPSMAQPSISDIIGYTAPVNPDWNATSGPAQILNKPALNNALTVNGAAVPSSQACVGTNASSQLVGGTCVSAANNLSDLASASAARTNLGLTAAAIATLPLSVANGGSGTATPSLVGGTNVTISGTWPNQTITASATGSSAFSGLTSSTNSNAAMVVGTGASLATSGTGTIAATSVPASGVTGVLAISNGGTGTTTGIPVQSVAGRTGAITLSTSDIGGYAAPVNPDWNATSGLAQILNKPVVNNAVTVNGAAIPASQSCVGTNASAQIVDGTCLSSANNLSDIASASAARTNLGLTGAATATLPLSVANGGTGTANASLVGGSNVTVTGTWPNQTIAATVPTVASTTNLLAGDGAGNVSDSGVPASSIVTISGTQTLTNKSISSGQVTGLAPSAIVDTTNASNITSGTLPAAQLPNPTATTLGGTQSIASVAHNFLTGISTNGVPSAAQPAFSDISGVLSVASGGTGTTTPSLVGGSNVTITGTWPNQTISAAATGGSGGGGLNPPSTGSGLLLGSSGSAATTVAMAGVDFQAATSRSVANYGNGQTNGIQSAVAACGTTISCSIVAPPTYGATETRPCVWGNVGQIFSTNGCAYTMSPNVTFFDYRYGVYSQNADSGGLSPNGNYQAWQRMDFITTSPMPLNNPSLYFTSKVASNVNLLALGGGVNINVAAYPNKAFYIGNDTRLHGYTGGQKIGYQSFVNSYAVGDALGYYAINTCYGGFNAGSDEGCEAMDIQATQGTVEYTGTVSRTSGNTVTVAATIGDGTQGEGRFLVDTSQAITSGTISAIGTTGPVVLTGSGTSWPVSTVNTTSASTVAAPGVATIAVASASGISTSTTLCVADGYEIEQVVPTAVSGNNVTANFRYPHQPGMFVTAGGLSCHYIALTADIATSAAFPSLAYKLQNSLHWVVPIISSSSPTSLTLWLQSPNSGWVGYRGRWTAANGGYAIYPGAQVTSVMQNQQLSSTLTLETPVSFATGDSVILPHYHNLNVYEALHSVQRVFPQVNGGNPAAWWLQLNGLWTDTDTALEVDNNTPASVYAGGKQRPLFMRPRGSWDSILYFDAQPSNMARSEDGSVATNIFMQTSNLGYAYLGSDPINHRWTMGNYFNGSIITFDWQAGNIQTPGKIYAAASITPQLQTGVTANSDLAGFITLTSGTGTYSFAGGYTNAPICTANDNTAVAPVRVQTTNTTLTVTGTGTDLVSYVCIARN